MTMRATFKRFARARKGLAALEFALLAPMMVFFLLGSIDMLDMVDTNRRLQYATVSVADVMARDTEVTDDEIDGAWAALELLMAPDNAAGIEFRVSSVSVQDATTARVIWSEGQGMAPRGTNSTVALPAGMMVPGTSVIMTESEFDYASPLGILTAGNATLDHVAYRRSRLIDPIPRG